MKLALAMISEGNHPHLKRAVASVYKYVDGIFITTTKVNKPQWEDPRINWSFFRWNDDFSAARNYNLSKIPPSFTHILWLDSDDVVRHPEMLQEVCRTMEQKNLDAVFVDYNYDIDQNGNVQIVHPRERIVRNGIYHWKAKLHETLIPNRRVQHIFIKDFAVDHYPTKENKANGLMRNLKVLQGDYEAQRRELVQGKITEIDPRTEYYLARCLYDTHIDTGLKRAMQLFQDYLQHSGWDEERAFAWNYIGNILFHFRQYEESTLAYLSAIKERPEFPTWHINLARAYAAMHDWGRAEHHITVGINMKQPNTAMIITPLEDKKNALTVLYFVFWEKKDFKQCKKAAEMLLDIDPSRDTQKKLESVEKLERWTNWMKNVAEMAGDLYNKNEIDKVDHLLAGLPDDVENTVMADTLKAQYSHPKIWPKNSICYYAAIDVHTWSPKDLKTGLGGSEQAIINLTRQWTKMGYKVTVYTNVGADEGTYEGVEYKNFYRFNSKDKFDIVVSWRNPHFIHKNLLDARLVLLDLHDVPEVGEYSTDLLNKVDYIMVKSPYHRSLLPDVPDQKFKIVGNGINWNTLQKIEAVRKPHAIFYGSSPDRGLENLLDIWPEILAAVPDAELHVCYGFELFLKLRGHVKSYRDWYDMMMQKLKQPGITHHGKVGEKELYTIAKSCSIWAYPTNFQEIDCITARYCQALGTMPLVYGYAALKTSVQRGVQLAVDPFDRKSLDFYKDDLIRYLQDPHNMGDRADCITNAKAFDWTASAAEWVKVFNETKPQDIKLTVFTPTIRTGFWNLMAENLARQSYKNFEWLIVDDYKEDRREIAKKYAEKYGLTVRYMRGKLDRSKYNYALIQADNMAVYNATGDVIVWLQDFILMPEDGLERIVNLHRRYPTALIAPVDQYNRMKSPPNRDDKEDWFYGKTGASMVGEFIRQNIRIKLEEVRQTFNPYDLELNYGAIPTKVARKLNGFWEFQDDGLGFNNTDIAFRALRAGYPIIIDERNRAICLDLWEYLTGDAENAIRREWNLNDARFTFLVSLTKSGALPLVRDANIDRKLKLDNHMPDNLDQEGAAHWIQKNAIPLAKRWIKELAL